MIANYKNAGNVRKYLQSLQSTDKQSFDSEGKPEYHYPLGCEVHFDEEVIEIFKQQEGISKEDLLEAYIKVKDSLGRQPTIADVNDYGEYSAYYYIKVFGTWNDFLELIGEASKLSPEKLRKAYYIVKDKIGHEPTLKEMKDHCPYSPSNYSRFWGSWNKFLESIGEVGNLNPDILIPAYYEVKKCVGHIPTQKEMD